MKTIPEELYKRIQKISEEVKQDLRRKGLVVPVKQDDGSITVGTYTIVKDPNGYTILDFCDEEVVTGINLPQTAIIVANKLALGYYKDTKLLEEDKRYGFAEFEEKLYKRAMLNKSIDQFDIFLSKHSIAHYKKQEHKKTIINSFEKLIKLV